jgi:hypothetical protein
MFGIMITIIIMTLLQVLSFRFYNKYLYNKGKNKDLSRTVFIFNEPFVIITDKEYSDYIVYKCGGRPTGINDILCNGCYWVENKPLTPVCDTCRIIRSNHKGYEHSIAETKVEEYNG